MLNVLPNFPRSCLRVTPSTDINYPIILPHAQLKAPFVFAMFSFKQITSANKVGNYENVSLDRVEVYFDKHLMI